MKTKVFTLIGAESTGKTTLARQLAEKFNCPWIPEYARFYVEQIKLDYSYNDVVNIAKAQIWLWQESLSTNPAILIQDTDLIITKIWFEEVFHKIPDWIDGYIEKMLPTAYLFCETDLPWQPDPVRENPGEQREYLSERYKKEIRKFKAKMHIITGKGQQRLSNAVEFIKLQVETKPIAQ